MSTLKEYLEAGAIGGQAGIPHLSTCLPIYDQLSAKRFFSDFSR